MSEDSNYKEKILNEYPRLGMEDKFNFLCHKGSACFTECCGDVNIVLTPYDIIRMKSKLGIDSEEFLLKYTISPFDKDQILPVIILKMSEDGNKKCPFVGPDGCKIYDDRPWACRMYPLGMASPGGDNESKEDFYFVQKEAPCLGFNEERELTIKDWLSDQGISIYNEMGSFFKEIALHEYLMRGGILKPDKMEMFYLVSYNIDKFKKFVFESSFLTRFEIDKKQLKKIKSDDVELMKFGFNWLKFCLFAEKTMKVTDEEITAKKGKIYG